MLLPQYAYQGKLTLAQAADQQQLLQRLLLHCRSLLRHLLPLRCAVAGEPCTCATQTMNSVMLRAALDILPTSATPLLTRLTA
jgi:hypothetical protein